MEWNPIIGSSSLSGYSYDSSNQTLLVEFKNGGRYNYFDVSENIFEQMKTAPSKGQFLAQQVKGSYRYARA